MSHACWQVLAHKLILSGNQNRAALCTIKNNGEVEVFACCERKEGTVDGKVQDCQFRQPMGICTESESVIYTCDAQTNPSRPALKWSNASNFSTLLVSFLTPFPSIVKEQVTLLSLPMKRSPLSASVKSF